MGYGLAFRNSMIITVIIPTYHRPKALARCLAVLGNQSRPADEILVVIRHGDLKTRGVLEAAATEIPGLRIESVGVPGQIAAQNAGLDKAVGDIIVFTDDDTVPDSHWLRRIEDRLLTDSRAGGAGGRDRVYRENRWVDGRKSTVGRILWSGRIIGNHHLGFGSHREVDHLKGSNMAFRKTALNGIRFDIRLRGKGAQYRNDMALCLAVKRKGWKLIYDPEIMLDHMYAARYEYDQRDGSDLSAIQDAAHNEMLIFLDYLPLPKRLMCIFFALLVGSRFTPGVIQWLRLYVKREKEPWGRFKAAIKGRIEGWDLLRKR